MYKFELPYQYRIMRICGSELKKTEHIFRVKTIIQKHKISLVSRDRSLVFKRQLLMWYLRNNTNLNLKRIGLICGKKDHATVLHGVKTVDNYLEYKDKYFKEVTNEINTELRAIFTIKAF
jgi:chromosomal replication initiation ATPase DnaA